MNRATYLITVGSQPKFCFFFNISSLTHQNYKAIKWITMVWIIKKRLWKEDESKVKTSNWMKTQFEVKLKGFSMADT